MEQNIYWTPQDEPGLEHLQLSQTEEVRLADGMILRMMGGASLRVHYQIRTDLQWHVREVKVVLLHGLRPSMILHANGQGHWTDAQGKSLPALDGCIDVDISVTPFTNTLPIRRLGLRPGESGEITVAYVAVPEMTVQPARQRYTCIEIGSGRGIYRYEGLFRQFTADLPVDVNGLVMDYPETFRRVWPLSP